MTLLQALILGLLQGVSELFPISSLGHSILLPALFGWNIQHDDPYFLNFLIATHLATAIVLLAFFWRDWIRILRGMYRSLFARRLERRDTYAKLGWLLVAGTVPAGLLGLLLEHPLRELFRSAQVAAFFLIINGCILLAAEWLRRRILHHDGIADRTADDHIVRLSIREAVSIGAIQSLALIPGISRSGSSMVGGLRFGLNYEEAARFSFLLATPIIGAAAVLKLPELFTPDAHAHIAPIIAGSIASAVSAYLAVRFLTKFFHNRTLRPFAMYCIAAGIVASIILAIR